MIPSFTPSAPTSHPSNPRQVAVVHDDKAIFQLVEEILRRSGMSQSEIARRLGIKLGSLTQYRRRTRPSLRWLARLVEVTGARIYVEFPR